MAKRKPHIFETRPTVTREDMRSDVQELVTVRRAKGQDAMKARFDEIVQERQLVNWEARVLAEHVVNSLTLSDKIAGR